MKALISQPMHGKTNEEMAAARARAVSFLLEKGYEIEDTLVTEPLPSGEPEEKGEPQRPPLYYLAKFLERMHQCHAAFFCKEWENDLACFIEHEAAQTYRLDIIYEQ